MASRKEAKKREWRKYSAEKRQDVVAEAAGFGLTRTAEKYEMPISTLFGWMNRAGTGKREKGGRGAKERAAAAAISGGPKAAEVRGVIGLKKRPAMAYTPSLRALILEDAATLGPTAAAEKHGCSRFAVYDWARKVERAAAGLGVAPTSGPDLMDVEALRDKEILDEWHRHPGLGPSQIRNQLRAKCVKVSVNTARRVMQDNGYRPPKVERRKHDERFEAVRPNHMWHLDFVQRYVNRTTTFTLILIDDHSRYVVGHGIDEAERSEMVIETFEEAVKRHGRPEMVMHDKGGAFWSWKGISRFTALLTEMGIDQVVAEHKEWNGKVEVFNANIQKELFNVHRFSDLSDMKRRLAAHMQFYNHARTHHALGGLLVPADRYFGRADEVLARIEAGVPRDATDTMELRDRCLEMFKVASTNGVPEIWLMGQQLFPAPTAR